MNKKLKPKKLPFIAFSLFVRTILGIILAAGAYFILNISPILLVVLFAVFIGYSYYKGSVAYRKEEYIFEDKKIIQKSGGIFSDYEQELSIENITHLKLKFYFIEQKIFQTGTIFIQSAGSGGSEITLASIENPKKIYHHLQQKMKQNGFQIDRDELLEQEAPNTLAVILELLSGAVIGSLFILSMSVWLFIPALIIGLPYGLWRYLDLKKREYELYQGSIVYKGNFLNKEKTIVPIENLSDSNLNQNFIGKMLGLYDLSLSSQGGGQEIRFKNIKKGKKFDEKIDELMRSEAYSLETKQRDIVGQESTDEDTQVDKKENRTTKKKQKNTRGLDSVPKKYQSFKKDLKKVILAPVIYIGLVFLLLGVTAGIFWLVIMTIGGDSSVLTAVLSIAISGVFLLFFALIPIASKIMKFFAIEYSLKEQSIRKEYNLFSTDITEFSDDKITGVYFKKSILDRIFGTYSIHFWSIGSSSNIVFSDIKQDSQLDNLIKEKFDFITDDKTESIVPKFSLDNFIKKKTITMIIAGVYFSVLAVVGYIINSFLPVDWVMPAVFFGSLALFIVYFVVSYFYNQLYYDKAEITLSSDFLTAQTGIFSKYQYYFDYNDIKGIVTTKYPWINSGKIKFKVGGGRTINQNQDQSGTAYSFSNSFSLNFIPNIPQKDEAIDLILEQKQDYTQLDEIEDNIEKYKREDIITTGPDIANAVVPVIIISIIIFPLIILLPLTLAYRILSTKKKSYHLQPYRVCKKWGILYRKQQSIVFRKIDHINKDQGFLNKMFSNGNIATNTVASSGTEMSLDDLSDYEKFYAKIQEIY